MGQQLAFSAQDRIEKSLQEQPAGQGSPRLSLSLEQWDTARGTENTHCYSQATKQGHLDLCKSWGSESLCSLSVYKRNCQVANKINAICPISGCLQQTKNFPFPRPAYVSFALDVQFMGNPETFHSEAPSV